MRTMKHSSLSKLFWGLFLLFFNINIAHLELFTTSLGMLLLVVSVWQLSRNSPWLKRAFFFSIAAASVKAAEIVLFCLRQGSELTFSLTNGPTAMGNMGIAFGMSLLGSVCMILLFYNLLIGLGNLAEQMGDKLLARRLYCSLWLYFAVIISSYAILLFPILILLFIIIIFIEFVYILVQVHHFGIAADEDETLQERALGGCFYGAMGGALLLVLGVSFAALLSVNTPIVPSRPYIVQDSTSARTRILGLRQKLRIMGFKQAVLADLPDSEILHYEGAQSVVTSSQQWTSDDGDLSMTQYFTQFASGKVRILYYYKWLTLPRQRFCDSFSIDMFSQVISVLPESELEGFALYDKKTASGSETSRVNFLELQGGASGMTPLVKYRLFGNEALHQRGFLAYFAQIPKDQDQNIFTIIANYTHQTSLLDFDETNQQTNQTGSQYFFMQSSYAEQQFQLMFNAQYDTELKKKSSTM